MKSIFNRILIITLAVCALSVGASIRLGQMHGQEKIVPPKVIEELPGRPTSVPDSPIIYGNQTPFGALPETRDENGASSNPQTVLRQSYDVPPGVAESELPGRAAAESGSIIPQASPAAIPERRSIVELPQNSLPSPTNVAAGDPCPDCGSETCTICCQPKCVTRTILIPQYHTVWSSIFETRYRTEIKEEAYTIEREVDHQVPRVVQETVMVAEPRIRTFQDFREEEYQVPVEEPYSVMVRKPRERMVPVEREETYRYPEGQEYEVMVPREKIVTETKYKTIVEKEPRQEKYTVDVKRERTRMVVDYVEKDLKLRKRVPVTRKQKKELQREVWSYENKTVTMTVDEPYIKYVPKPAPLHTQKANVIRKRRTDVEVDAVQYVNRNRNYQQQKEEQVTRDVPVKQTYTVAVPYFVTANENYTVSEPYYEDVVISWESRRQAERQVTRKYSVRIPYIENIPRQYKVKVPYTVMKKGKRTIPRQIPKTRYQTVKRDMGKWVTNVETIPTYEIGSDHCGCSTCCPKTRTVRKTVWQPKIVTSRVPYTVFETVKQTVPYEYPVLEYREEMRDRMEPVTRYRTEERETSLTVYDFEPTVETKTVKVQKYRQLPRTRAIRVQKFREEQRERIVKFDKYETVNKAPETFSLDVREPQITTDLIDEEFTELDPKPASGPEVDNVILVPEPAIRKKTVSFVVREPKMDIETYEVEVELEDFETVEEVVKVQVPVPRKESYIETVPEIRTRLTYVDVEKRVPYVETKTTTEMVPEKRTRTVYKTAVRTVRELKPEVYFESEQEIFNRTVYKKKVRNVPVNRAEIYWVKVPKVLKKTVFQTVKRKVKKPMIRRVPVRVPYQVESRIPRRVCTMVPHTVTVPVEECCEHCVWHLPGVATAANAWAEYGWNRTTNFIDWIREEY